MTNLSTIVEQIKSEIVVDHEGKGRASIRAVARLVGVDHKSLRVTFLSGELEPSKLSLMLVERGFDSGEQKDFSKTGIPDIAIAVIAKYYAYKAGRYCTEQAQLVDEAFTAMGVRVWMQQVTGWKPDLIQRTAKVEKPTPSQICDAIDAMFSNTCIEPFELVLYKGQAVAEYYPELEIAMEWAYMLVGKHRPKLIRDI